MLDFWTLFDADKMGNPRMVHGLGGSGGALHRRRSDGVDLKILLEQAVNHARIISPWDFMSSGI